MYTISMNYFFIDNIDVIVSDAKGNTEQVFSLFLQIEKVDDICTINQ